VGTQLTACVLSCTDTGNLKELQAIMLPETGTYKIIVGTDELPSLAFLLLTNPCTSTHTGGY